MKCAKCENEAIARSLCRNHYQQAWRSGSLPDDLSDQRRAPLKSRLLDKVRIDTSGCWIFEGARAASGYGMIWKGDRNVAAHREAYRIFKGSLRDDEVVCHSCDVRECVNPDHLFKGDRALNNLDMRTKERHRFGETSPHAKLTEADIYRIKNDQKSSHSSLARAFKVAQSTISRIKSGKRWSHLS